MSRPQPSGVVVSASTVTPGVRRTAVGSVLVVAAVAAVMSYGHLYSVARDQGEPAAALLPLSVDGLIVAAGLVLLVRRRAGERGGLLPWCGLLIGIAATVAGNVASADPTVLARVVAAWPPIALALAYELLLVLLRPASAPGAAAALAEPAGQTGPTDRPVTEDRPADVPDHRTAELPDSRSAGPVPDRPVRPVPAGGPDVAALLPAARTVAAHLAREGRGLSRSALLTGLRDGGHTCSTERAGALLATLRAEQTALGQSGGSVRAA